jgi:hypothetical protein
VNVHLYEYPDGAVVVACADRDYARLFRSSAVLSFRELARAVAAGDPQADRGRWVPMPGQDAGRLVAIWTPHDQHVTIMPGSPGPAARLWLGFDPEPRP